MVLPSTKHSRQVSQALGHAALQTGIAKNCFTPVRLYHLHSMFWHKLCQENYVVWGAKADEENIDHLIAVLGYIWL